MEQVYSVYLMYMVFAVKIAVIAVVYSTILVAPGNILSRWKSWLDWRLNRKNSDGEYVSKWHVIYDPIVGCVECVTGQMMLWGLVLTLFTWWFALVINIVFMVSVTILISNQLKRIIK